MASVAGRVTERLEALAPVRLMAGGEVECLVDTGANCALVLPYSVVDDLGLPVVGRVDDLGLVGEETTSADIALAQVEWLGEVRYVEVVVRNDFILGTQLLGGAVLMIDYPNRTLTVTRREGGE
jgi:predicted aspartyl protease